MALYNLGSRGVVRVRGEDAAKLLNDTLTCRFADLSAGTGRWFALLSPQGKVLIEGLVAFADDAYWFDLEAAWVADFVKRMKMYRLRAKAEIEDASPVHAVLWSPDGEPAPKGAAVSYRDERGVAGVRSIVDRADAAALPEGAIAYAKARVAVGVMEAPDFGANQVFPHDVGMDVLKAVDFKKGCYVGQEVVSRMQHRGTARRRPVVVSGLPDGAGVGAPLLVGEREIGEIGVEANGKAMAMVRLDRIDDGAATFAGLPVILALPSWATYRFGESAAAE